MAKAKPNKNKLITPEQEQKRQREDRERRLAEAGVNADRDQHDVVVIEQTMQAGQRRARIMTECVIDQYRNRSQIDDRVWTAGIQLRALWMRAAHQPALTSAYGEQRGNGGGSGTGIEARQTLTQTMEGAGLAKRQLPASPSLRLTMSDTEIWMERYPSTLTLAGHIAIDVCGMDNFAGGTHRLVMLREALTALADYWKIASAVNEMAG